MMNESTRTYEVQIDSEVTGRTVDDALYAEVKDVLNASGTWLGWLLVDHGQRAILARGEVMLDSEVAASELRHRIIDLLGGIEEGDDIVQIDYLTDEVAC